MFGQDDSITIYLSQAYRKSLSMTSSLKFFLEPQEGLSPFLRMGSTYSTFIAITTKSMQMSYTYEVYDSNPTLLVH